MIEKKKLAAMSCGALVSLCGLTVGVHGQSCGLAELTTIQGVNTLNGWDTSVGRFGFAVDGAGDVNNDGYDDVIIGGYNDWIDPADFGAGTVNNPGYVKVISGNGYAELFVKLGPSSGSHFGTAVSGAGDINNDGFDDFIVGAQIASSFRGQAFVYSGATGAELSYSPITGGSAGDLTARFVSGGQDANNDTTPDIVVGEYYNDTVNGTDSGSVAVYNGANGSLLWRVNGNNANDLFGWFLNFVGDVNNDGYDDVAVGAPLADVGALTNSGYLRVLSGLNGSAIYTSDFQGTLNGGRFGSYVDGVGDIDGDGYDDFIIGAPGEESAITGGRAYLISGQTGLTLKVFTGFTPGESYGSSLAGVGDINGDTTPDFVVAGPGFSSGRGAVYLYSGAGPHYEILAIMEGDNPGDNLGYTVAGAGDVNNDGVPDIIAGGADANNFTGYARIYSGASTFPLCSCADVNTDGAVTASDVSTVFSFLNQDCSTSNNVPLCNSADINGNGVIDEYDYVSVLAFFCQDCP
ncbi:MAG: FG-GAP-like repeat-containing protein [Planctomycetota bacterium]